MIKLKDSLHYFNYDVNNHFKTDNLIAYEDLKDFIGYGIYTNEELNSGEYNGNNGLYEFNKEQITEFFKRIESFINNNALIN